MRYILVVSVIIFLVSDAFCEDSRLREPEITFSAGSGVMRGHTTYQVGGKFEVPAGDGMYGFPVSELEFPLDVAYGSLGMKLGLWDRLEGAGMLRKNLSDNAGKMEDRDWGLLYRSTDWWTDPDSLDVFSVSDTEIDALVAEFSARLYSNPWQYSKYEVIFYLGGKYIHQKFDVLAGNLEQWSRSLTDYYEADMEYLRIPGEVLTYEVTKKIPAAIAGCKLAAGKHFTVDLSLGYSPSVTVKDRDRHLLRSLVSKAKCDGDAFLISLAGEIKIFSQCSLDLKYDYTEINTKGMETQYHPDGFIATIEQKNFSDIHMVEVAMAYRF